jgi:hypothetical protein
MLARCIVSCGLALASMTTPGLASRYRPMASKRSIRPAQSAPEATPGALARVPATSSLSRGCKASIRPPINWWMVMKLDWIKARLLPIRKLDRQQPGLLAQLQRAVESIRGSGRGGCLVHLSISFVARLWTKESEGRLRRPSSAS